MFVKLFSGLPGAGKTAQLVAAMLKMQRDEPGRPLFAMGINGLKEGIATPLTMEMLHEWWELPSGSVICIDECQEEHLMPLDGGRVPHWVQRIAKVRHHGMTFMLTTQHPKNMSAYVRRLVDQHVHTVNKFGTSVIARYTWGRCMDEPEKGSIQKAAIEDIGTLPKEVFDLYKSSSLHTRKRRIPRKVYMFFGLALTAIAAMVATPILIKRAHDQSQVAVTAGVTDDASTLSARAKAPDRQAVDESLRVTDYPKWLRPRVEGQPWTAPAFDHLQVRAEPRVFCVANEDGGCHCRTEQGTRYEVAADMCRTMVREGGAYNPFQEPVDVAREERRQRTATEAALLPATAAEGQGGPTSSAWNRMVGTAVYTPPEQTVVSAISGN